MILKTMLTAALARRDCVRGHVWGLVILLLVRSAIDTT